ncbi:MAG: IclR family transcriptional regulator [Pseudomonadales bacterium]
MADASSPKTAYKAPALEKGLEILEYLSAARQPCSMVVIAEALGRSKHEIYRMLHVLEGRGYIARGETDERFSVTNKLFELGMRNPPIRNLHDVALPHMRELADSLEQSCQLVVRTGTQMVVVARVESPIEIGLTVRVGYRRHIMQSTSGRILYAFHTQRSKEKFLKELLASVPDGVDVDGFMDDAEQATQQGCIAHDSDFVDGVVDIGAPIFDLDHEGAIASLTVPFMQGRYTTIALDTAIERVKSTAGTISAILQVGQ